MKGWIDANAAWLHYAGPAAGAAAVVAIGKLLAKRHEEAPVVLDDLAAYDPQPAADVAPAAKPD